MKKLLTILLVLLVAGFVFADEFEPADFPGEATLTLQSSVIGVTIHGFYGEASVEEGSGKLTGSDITISGMSDSANNSREVSMVSDDPQFVGYYSFRSNSATGVKITISGDPLALETGSANPVNVPYELSFLTNATDSKNITVPANALVLGSAGVPYLTAKTSYDDLELLNALNAGGEKWATYTLHVSFNEDNADYGLPEGEYSASITATITAN